MGRTILIAREASPDEQEVIERKGGIRLNGAMRKSILEKALEHAFGKREKALLKDSITLGHEAMVDCFGAARIAAARKASYPFVIEGRDFYGNKAPDGVLTTFRVGYKQIALHVQDPLPIRINDFKHFTVKDPTLIAEIETYADAAEALKTERNKVHTTLEAMLNGVQTLASLERTWPEGKKVYAHIPKEFPFRHQVPATLVSDLNKALGL